MRIHHFLTAGIAAALVLCLIGAAGPMARITKNPPKVVRKTFDPAAPPKEMPKLSHGEEAICVSSHSMNAMADMVIDEKVEPDGGKTAHVKISAIRATIGLEITIWCPTDAHASLKEHEEGHRKLYEMFYKDAESVAKQVCGKSIGRTIVVPNAASRQIISKAVEKEVLVPMMNQYLAEIRKPANRVNELFDEITDHNRNRKVTVEEGMKQAVERWKSELEGEKH